MSAARGSPKPRAGSGFPGLLERESTNPELELRLWDLTLNPKLNWYNPQTLNPNP